MKYYGLSVEQAVRHPTPSARQAQPRRRRGGAASCGARGQQSSCCSTVWIGRVDRKRTLNPGTFLPFTCHSLDVSSCQKPTFSARSRDVALLLKLSLPRTGC